MTHKNHKDYIQWMPVKAKLHNARDRPLYKEREVFWISIGENVGFEEDGKNARFNRPVLVIKKFSAGMCWGIPLSTTEKRGKYYLPIRLNTGTSVALLSQLRTFDTSRFNNKIGMVSETEFAQVRLKIAELLLD